jgi:hypothetical protein
MFRQDRGLSSVFYKLGLIQKKVANFRKLPGYINPADILPPVAWYDTHAAR